MYSGFLCGECATTWARPSAKDVCEPCVAGFLEILERGNFHSDELYLRCFVCFLGGIVCVTIAIILVRRSPGRLHSGCTQHFCRCLAARVDQFCFGSPCRKVSGGSK